MSKMTTENEKYWYPLLTKSNQEKKALFVLNDSGYEAFLPLNRKVQQWSDRKKVVDFPLIKSYVFVRSNKKSIINTLKLSPISGYVRTDNKPSTISDETIDLLKRVSGNEILTEFDDASLNNAKPCKIKSGPLEDYEGHYIAIKRKKYLVIRFELFDKVLLVNIDDYI